MLTLRPTLSFKLKRLFLHSAGKVKKETAINFLEKSGFLPFDATNTTGALLRMWKQECVSVLRKVFFQVLKHFFNSSQFLRVYVMAYQSIILSESVCRSHGTPLLHACGELER